jgi:enamine deaminase RidA (YjgF/YER057c/UK114 family)
MVAPAGARIVFIAGQVGWNAQQQFESEDLLPQFEQACATCWRCWPKPAAGPSTSAA